MNNLTRFENDGIEIFIDPLGNSFASIRGVARMAQTSEATIRLFIGAQEINVINAKVETLGGLQGAQLLSEDDIVEVLAEYNVVRLKQFAKLGVQIALHQIAGYKRSVEADPFDPYSKQKVVTNKDSADFRLLKDWANALIQSKDEDLEYQIKTTKELGGYLMQKVLVLVGFDERYVPEESRSLYRIGQKSLNVEYQTIAERKLIEARAQSKAKKSKGFGKPKK
jgi:hypothetical protein